MPQQWRFKCYVDENGVDHIRAAYEARSEEAHARFVSKLRTLGQLPLQQWREPLYRALHREAAGLGEVRFKAKNVQQRPLGFVSGSNEFT
jgi:hypothetical protein